MQDPWTRRDILEEAASDVGCWAHKSGYGSRFEVAMRMEGEGLLSYAGKGSCAWLTITAKGREELARLRGERR